MTNIKSRTESSYMVRKGRGRPRRETSRKGVHMYVGQKMCPTGKSLTLGFFLPQSCRKVIMHSQEEEGEPQEASPQKGSALL